MSSNHSKVALEWLLWQDSKFPEPRIRHARNAGEYRIPNSRYTVDGYDEETNTVYEFQGCFFHVCRTCYPNRTEPHSRLENRCADDVFRCTQKKITGPERQTLQHSRDLGMRVGANEERPS